MANGKPRQRKPKPKVRLLKVLVSPVAIVDGVSEHPQEAAAPAPLVIPADQWPDGAAAAVEKALSELREQVGG